MKKTEESIGQQPADLNQITNQIETKTDIINREMKKELGNLALLELREKVFSFRFTIIPQKHGEDTRDTVMYMCAHACLCVCVKNTSAAKTHLTSKLFPPTGASSIY